MKQIKGHIYVRFQPADVNINQQRGYQDKQNELVKIAEQTSYQTLFNLEQWLNSEIATQAFEKFKVGVSLQINSFGRDELRS
jgi:ssDNA-specific exonuclease RecJ